MRSNEAADEIFICVAELDADFGFVAVLSVVFDFLARLGGAFLRVVVALRVTLLCKKEMSLCFVRTSSSFIFASRVSPRRSQEFSVSISQMSINSYLSVRYQSVSETQCQRLNVRVGFTNLVRRLYCTFHLGVQFDIGERRDSGFVVLSFPFLDCCKAFRECRPATHSIYVLGGLLQHGDTDFFYPVRNASGTSPWDSWWCHNDGCLADMRVAEWI
jgi:hypothetical protein